jgi:hypothetical protein
MALASVKGNFMTDYDVINIGFPPESYKKLILNRTYTGIAIVNMDVGRVPCAVHVDNLNANEQLLQLLGSKMLSKSVEVEINGKSHVSDMHMFAGLRIGTKVEVCHLAEFAYPLRHFSSDSSGGLTEKIEKIRNLLNSKQLN